MFLQIILSFLGILLVFSFIWIVITYLIRHRNYFGYIDSRWHYLFDGQQFAGKEIYKSITDAITARQIPNISMSRTQHWQTGYFDSKREYLNIARKDQFLLVCASPFGTGYFISWWLGEPISFGKDLVPRIPFIGGWLFRMIYTKTYYQQDTDTMFYETVHLAILEVIDNLCTENGIRGLSELERRPVRAPHGQKL